MGIFQKMLLVVTQIYHGMGSRIQHKKEYVLMPKKIEPKKEYKQKKQKNKPV